MKHINNKKEYTMKKNLILVIACLISLQSLQLNATDDESNVGTYVKNSVKIAAGALLMGLGAICFFGRVGIGLLQTQAENDWNGLLEKYNNDPRYKQHLSDMGVEEFKLDCSRTKKFCLVGSLAFGVPGLALIIHGSKKIHEARTAE
jgi:hypothetical protein